MAPIYADMARNPRHFLKEQSDIEFFSSSRGSIEMLLILLRIIPRTKPGPQAL